MDIPKHSSLSFNDAVLEFCGQHGRKVFFQHLSGKMEVSGTLQVKFHAVTDNEI